MPTPLDTTRLARSLLEPDERKLIDRMSMLPIGQYEDGSLTLAWPGMLKDMYEGAVRSYEQGRQLPRVDEQGNYAGTPRAEPLDAFNAASIAPMAGVAGRVTGGIPRGALGSGGSDMLTRAASDLPMDRASRLARADELGFTTPAFRGLKQPYSAEEAAGRPQWFSADEATAGKYGEDPLASRIRTGKAFEADAWAGGAGTGSWYEIPLTDEQLSMLGMTVSRHPFTPQGFAGLSDTDTIARYAKDAGFDSAVFRNVGDGAGTTSVYSVFDPRNIRSVNAAFDPAKSDSANLLAANPSSASLPSLLMSGEDDLDTQDILKRYGLLGP